MGKGALCVGINDYPYDGADLNGCVNDARAWANLLIDHYDFPPTDVKLLVDNQATKSKVMEALKSLAAGTKAGDVLVLTISSQGTYVADTSGETGYAEGICPYDCADNLVAVDELHDVCTDLTKNVLLTIILDTSFIGTATRAVVSEFIPGLRTPDERRMRFLSRATLNGRDVIETAQKSMRKREYSQALTNAIVLRACSHFEYAYDAMIDGTFHGAMTYFAL
jgi:metacaspase-1